MSNQILMSKSKRLYFVIARRRLADVAIFVLLPPLPNQNQDCRAPLRCARNDNTFDIRALNLI